MKIQRIQVFQHGNLKIMAPLTGWFSKDLYWLSSYWTITWWRDEVKALFAARHAPAMLLPPQKKWEEVPYPVSVGQVLQLVSHQHNSPLVLPQHLQDPFLHEVVTQVDIQGRKRIILPWQLGVSFWSQNLWDPRKTTGSNTSKPR